jgi:lysophospholipase L1-like esterase
MSLVTQMTNVSVSDLDSGGPPPPDYSWLSDAGIVFDGNSLTAGQGSTGGNTYPAQLIALLEALGITGIADYNFGVGGQTTSDMDSDVTTQIDPLILGGVQNILFAWEIGNDIYFNGDVSAAQTRFQNYCEDRQAAGWTVIVITLTPRNQSTSFGDDVTAFNAKLDAANTWLRANYTSFASGLVDVALDDRLSDYLDTTYFSDGIHYTNAGYGVVAELALPVITGLPH